MTGTYKYTSQKHHASYTSKMMSSFRGTLLKGSVEATLPEVYPHSLAKEVMLAEFSLTVLAIQRSTCTHKRTCTCTCSWDIHCLSQPREYGTHSYLLYFPRLLFQPPQNASRQTHTKQLESQKHPLRTNNCSADSRVVTRVVQARIAHTYLHICT